MPSRGCAAWSRKSLSAPVIAIEYEPAVDVNFSVLTRRDFRETMAIAIVDYGMGNLKSVANAVEAVGHRAKIVARPEEGRHSSGIILPGVGAFGEGMNNLRRAGWIELLEDEVIRRGTWFLGLCLGMQLLATTSNEHGMHEGLNWISGSVERLPASANIRLPHIGWNEVRFVKKHGLYSGLDECETFYFVHSFAFRPQDENAVSGVSSHGEEFAASIEKDNIYATQYHPEKSQKAGLCVLNNFLKKAA